jgi:hypothetical protein
LVVARPKENIEEEAEVNVSGNGWEQMPAPNFTIRSDNYEVGMLVSRELRLICGVRTAFLQAQL